MRTASLLGPIAAKPNFFRLLLLLTAVYGYVIIQLLRGEWAGRESGNGPIVFIFALWLLYRYWDERSVEPKLRTSRVVGILMLFVCVGLIYAVGVVGQISQLAYGSIIPFLYAGILLFQNKAARPKLD